MLSLLYYLRKDVQTLAKIARVIVRKIKSTFHSIERTLTTIKWRYLNSRNPSNIEIRGHLMVVKNIDYVSLARICVESFLYHHPNSSIVIHCDSMTVPELRKFAGKKWTKNRIKVKEDFDNSITVWQDQKLQLMLGLVGTSDFFIDADMRWNSPGEFPAEVTFFVQEFKFLNRAPFREIVSRSSLSRYKASTMKNVSFFSFGGKDVSPELIQAVWKTKDEWIDVISSDLIGEDDLNGL